MPTHYLLSDTARASLETDFGSRVEDYADRVRTHDADMPYRYGMIYPDDARRYRDEELSPSSWYAALCASAPDLAGRYARMAEGILSRSSGDVPSWTVRRPEWDATTFAEPEDLLLFGGAWALPIIDDPSRIADMARSMSFADPYELLAALGLYVRERVKLATRSQGDLPDMEYLRRGAHDVLVRTKICKVNHEDFTVSRTDITPYETLSPMGTWLRSLRPVVLPDRSGLSAYQSGQYRFFSILLKWADELGRKDELGQFSDGLMEKYAREGVNVSARRYDGYADSLATDTLDSHVDDLPRIGEDARSFHIFSGAGRSNSSQCERAWMDADGSLVFDDAPELRAPFARECLRLHPDELLSLARAVFAFEYQATGGASLLRLPQMLAYYRSADFASHLDMLRRF